VHCRGLLLSRRRDRRDVVRDPAQARHHLLIDAPRRQFRPSVRPVPHDVEEAAVEEAAVVVVAPPSDQEQSGERARGPTPQGAIVARVAYPLHRRPFPPEESLRRTTGGGVASACAARLVRVDTRAWPRSQRTRTRLCGAPPSPPLPPPRRRRTRRFPPRGGIRAVRFSSLD